LLALALLVSSVATAAPDAFDLLDRTVRAYGELASYRDHGELTIITEDGNGFTTEEYSFTSVADDAGGFVFRLRRADDATGTHVVWRRDGTIWHSVDGMSRPTQATSLAFGLMLGSLAVPALLVPVVLSDDPALIDSADAAALEGSESCDGGVCDILLLSWTRGLALARLWIDRDSALIRRIDVDELPPRSRGDAPSHAPRTITVRHHVDSLDEPLAAELFDVEPPTTAAPRVEEAGSEEKRDREDRRFVISDEISVELRTLPVRALDLSGRPIHGLGPADFKVTLGKQQIPVVGADWVPGSGREPVSVERMSMTPPAPLTPRDEIDGQLVVFFVQSDFNAVRIKGHLRILPFVREFLSALEPADWVAVVSFDSHLKLWHDFSRDRETVGDAIDRAVRFGGMPPILSARSRSLIHSFPAAEAKRAATPETALRLTARSLLDIRGEKTIVYLGWGLGRYGSFGFHMTPEYDRTLATLHAADASVFVLDVTDADYHTLEIGIRKVAQDTGGTYAKTNTFTRREVLRLTETISGYYLLTLDRDSLPEERQRLRIRLENHRGEVLLRQHHLSR